MDEKQVMRLLTETSKKLREVGSAVLYPFGVRLGQNLLLEELWKQDGLTPGEIADRLRIAGPTAVRMAQRMEARGILERRRDSHDGRLVRVYLTAYGRRLRKPMDRAFADLDTHAVAALSPADRDELARLLGLVLHGLRTYPVQRTDSVDDGHDDSPTASTESAG
ncbi:MarR family winged helix-turn-helix transcriptional regulator [Dactylosporangium sp. CA-139114]|uniref:MarR family winged helix-turn-helix transcriptional regulator n=1 Tax=Dactylosporangium sp. CA-139114 TaxID=3239931 RepID=UPI003D96AFAE